MESLSSLAFAGFSAQAFLRIRADGADSNAASANSEAGLARAEGGRRAHHGRRAEHDCAARPDTNEHDSARAPTGAPQSAAALSYGRSERTTLFITTQEGDTVQLKIKSRESGALETAEFEAGDRLISELTLKTESSLKISFVVNGNLSADELTAIQSVIEQAGALAQDFFDGDLPSAFAAAQELNVDAAQLATVGLRMSFREQLTYSQSGSSRAVAAAIPPTATTPTLPAASAASEAAPTSPTLPVVEEASPVTAVAEPVPPAASAPSSEAPPRMTGALEIVRGFLSQLMEKLATPAPSANGPGAPSMDLSLKLKIFQSMVTTVASKEPASNDASATLPALVPDTLDALAAQQAPVLHAVA
jgi:hypothetical protein